MARIVGGIGVSHSPTMARVFDRHAAGGPVPPAWASWFEGVTPVKHWLEALKPDQVVIVYNDHLNVFGFEAYPTFAIGVADRFPQADEGWGLRPAPDLAGDVGFGWAMTDALVHAEFDLTVCQEMAIDHGIYSWLPYLADPPWPWPMLPLAVNLVRHPIPTSRRLYKLGRALRAAVEGLAGDQRVLVVATGGMSHQISGARFGIANEGLDRYFLDQLQHGVEALVDTPQAEWMRLGGADAVELIVWFAMRGALSDDLKLVHRFNSFPEITGCGVIAFEEAGA